jgi:hypothetical protein
MYFTVHSSRDMLRADREKFQMIFLSNCECDIFKKITIEERERLPVTNYHHTTIAVIMS